MAVRPHSSSSGQRRPEPVSLPGIKPLAPSRLSDDVALRIRDLIISEDIAEGARLPPERELAERFGASRPTVSQALRALSLMGLVEIRRGSGAYVVRRPESMVTTSVNLMLDLDQHSVEELMQLRLWLETIGVREATLRAPSLAEEQVAKMRGALDRLKAATGDASERIAADTVFHATIIDAAQNPYLTAIYESVHTAILSFEFKHWVQRETVPDWLQDAGHEKQIALHAPILDAVLAEDLEAAQAAVERHHEVMVEHLDAALSPPEQGPGAS